MITEQQRKEWAIRADDAKARATRATTALDNAARLRLHPQNSDNEIIYLANAVERLLQENIELRKDRQDNLDRADTRCVDGCEAEAFTTKLALANRRIEMLRRGMLDLIHSNALANEAK